MSNIDDDVYSDIENCSMIDDNDTTGEDLVEGLGYNTIIGEFLPDLLESFNVSTKVTCFASKKNPFALHRKQHTEMFHRAYN